MQTKRKKIIQQALEYEIEDINTYSGYKGDLIVKITTKDRPAMMAIRKFALELDILEVVLKHYAGNDLYEVYCVTQDDKVYNLKVDDEKEHINDIWEKTIYTER